MDKIRFCGKNLESCLNQASKELNVPIDLIKYEIINEKNSLFRKSYIIEVSLESLHDVNDKTEKYIEKELEMEKFEEPSLKVNAGLVKIDDGNLVITNPLDENEKATIVKGSGLTLYVDGKEISGKVQVTKESKIEVNFPEQEAKRELNIRVSEDKMEAFSSIVYTPKLIYKLKDVSEGRSATLSSEVLRKEYPPKYTKDEIVKELKNKGIIFGIIEENIQELINTMDGSEVSIVSGQNATLSEDDKLEIYFKHTTKKEFEVDDSGNMDFKSIGNITGVNQGDVICRRIRGSDGLPGKNIYGQHVQAKRRKVKDLIAKDGCEFTDENTIIATIDGKPQVKGSVFSVHNVHQVQSDVDIKTGNIHFIGDVIIHGNVKEGMNVEAGNALHVNSSVLRAMVRAVSDIEIKGSVISSTIVAGGEYLQMNKYIEELEGFSNLLEEIYNTILDVKKNKVVKTNISDSDLLRVIIDNKYKIFRNRIASVMKCMQEFNDTNNKVFRILHDKFSDVYFSKVREFEELKTLENLVREKEQSMKALEAMSSDILLTYIQDSTVECSGNVYITGKGVYKSNITAMKEIHVLGQGESNVRGGFLRAKDQVKVKTVGAPTGVSTVLEVAKEGHIYCDVAYLNTKFIVGEREFTLYESSKNVHAYIGKDLELVVDKFKL